MRIGVVHGFLVYMALVIDSNYDSMGYLVDAGNGKVLRLLKCLWRDDAGGMMMGPSMGMMTGPSMGMMTGPGDRTWICWVIPKTLSSTIEQ